MRPRIAGSALRSGGDGIEDHSHRCMIGVTAFKFDVQEILVPRALNGALGVDVLLNPSRHVQHCDLDAEPLGAVDVRPRGVVAPADLGHELTPASQAGRR